MLRTKPDSKTAHTPGPWKVIEDPFISVVTEWTVMDDDDPSSATYHTIVHDCDHDGWVDLSVPRANARLIAAAPELLANLTELVERFECALEAVHATKVDRALIRRIRKTIAKAEGRVK